MPFDPTPVWNTKHRWSLCRNGNLNQQPEPEFLDEIGSRKPDRSLALTMLSYVFPLAIAWGGFTHPRVDNLITAVLFTQIFLFLFLIGSYRQELLAAVEWKKIPLRPYLAPGVSIGVLSPLSLVWVRGELAETLSWESVAQLQALWRISEWVIGVSSNVLFLIFLSPLVLAVAKNKFENESRKIWHKVFVPAALILLMVAIGQHWIVPIFYSDEFLMPWAAGALFLVGDVVRVASWVHLLGLFAKERVTAITIGEWLSLPLFAAAVTFINPGSLLGVAALYVASYVAYFVFNWKANQDSIT